LSYIRWKSGLFVFDDFQKVIERFVLDLPFAAIIEQIAFGVYKIAFAGGRYRKRRLRYTPADIRLRNGRAGICNGPYPFAIWPV
jgi:hypothetical protein